MLHLQATHKFLYSAVLDSEIGTPCFKDTGVPVQVENQEKK